MGGLFVIFAMNQRNIVCTTRLTNVLVANFWMILSRSVIIVTAISIFFTVMVWIFGEQLKMEQKTLEDSNV